MHSLSMTAYLATKGDLERLLLEWRQQHGPFFEFQVPGSPPVMVVSDPDAIREVRHISGMHQTFFIEVWCKLDRWCGWDSGA
jgi:cytochrome P450